VPPVTLSAATPRTAPQPATAPALAATSDPIPCDSDGRAEHTTSRGHLRLVVSQPSTGEKHGRGGPASCSCRPCTMARHPAYGPKLSVV
jgi:hypothetical protein